MTKTKNIALALLLAGMLAAGTAGAALAVKTGSASALDTGSTVTYPFEKGVDAFQYAPTFEGPKQTETPGQSAFIQAHFGANKDFTDVTYIAVQMKIEAGNFGYTVGVHQSGKRLISRDNGNKCYFVSEDGSVQELSMMNLEIRFSAGMTGTLIMPKDQLGWQDNNTGDITKIDSIMFDHNTQYHSGWKFRLGSVGVYKNGEIGADGTTFEKILDLSSKEPSKSAYYTTNAVKWSLPSEEPVPDPEPLVFDYPFRTGKDKEYYTATWTGFTNGDPTDNFQEVKVQFDTATADFSKASYLLLQLKMAGTPGVQYILNEGSRKNSPQEGKAFYFYPDNGTQAEFEARVKNAHINFSDANMGALVIPISTLAGNADLTKIDSVSFKTNSKYDGGFSLTIGEIGMYEGTAGSGTFTKLLDLSEAKNGKFTVSTSQADSQNKGRLDFNEGEPPITQLGDATVDVNANKHQASDYGIWDRNCEVDGTCDQLHPGNSNHIREGGTGTVTMTKDSYGLDAVQITPTNVKAGNDPYMATTLSGGGGFSWANKQGVSFWARNDSDTEIHFNVEVDCKKNNVADRFNVEGGHRYYLYDVRTGQTTIYLTKATATMGPICLPVGFEGWVRVPFSAYHKADWSEGGFPVAEFMKEGTIVSYLAVTVQAQEFANKTFSVNLFGAYATVPSFASALVQPDNTIAELMELDQLELQDPVGTAASAIAHQKVDMIVSKEEK